LTLDLLRVHAVGRLVWDGGTRYEINFVLNGSL